LNDEEEGVKMKIKKEDKEEIEMEMEINVKKKQESSLFKNATPHLVEEILNGRLESLKKSRKLS